MATISERLAYVLTFDTSSGVKSLDQFGKAADKNLKGADQKLDKLAGNMTKFGAGAMAFAGIAGVGLFKLASGAADAQANMSALEQVVGDVTAQEIGKWAEGSARAVGLASKEAVAASTQFAGLGKIIGLADKPLADFARSHVELAADMAAFKNVSPQQAIEDLSSAYAGSTEVLRKYNIFLDERTLKEAYARETGEEVTGTLTTQQKIIAVNSELYRQGADMLGQFGRESGELAGQQAILRAEMTNLGDEIGAGVLPHVVKLMGVASELVGVLGSLDAATNGTVGSFAALGVAGLAIAGSLSFVVGHLITMRERLIAVQKAIAGANMVAYAGWGAAIAAVAGGVFLLGKKLDDLNRDAMDHSSRVREVQGVYEDLKSSMAGSSPFDVAADQIKQLALESPLLTRAMREAGISIEDLAEAALGGAVPMTGLEMQLLATDAASQAGATSTTAFGETWQDITNQLAFAGAAVERVRSVTEENTEATDGNTDSLEAGRIALREYAEAQEAARQAAERMKEATLELGDSSLAYRNQQARTSETIRESYEVLDDAESSAQDVEQAYRDMEGAAYDSAAAAVQVAEDQATANGEMLTADEKTAIYVEELETLSAFMSGPAKVAIDAHIARLKDIPSSIYTNLSVGRSGDFSRSSTTGTVLHDGGVVGVGKFASDEVPAVLQKGEMVLTEGQQASVASAMAGGSGGGDIHITVTGLTGPQVADDLVNKIMEYKRRNGGLPWQ